MALPPFFERVYASTGGVLSLSRETLQAQIGETTVAIELNPDWERTSSYTADLAVNMAARLYGRLCLRGSDSWTTSASQLAKSINPDVEFFDGDAAFGVVVGNTPRPGDNIYVRNDGWVARMLAAPLSTAAGPVNPLAAGMAAALAMGELFRRIFKTHLPAQRPFENVAVSLLDFSRDAGVNDELTSAKLGNFAFAGLGAVANAAVSALARFEKLDGDVLLLDGQTVDLGNLQRYVLATAAHEGAAKVKLAADALAKSGLRVAERQLAFEDVAAEMTLPPVIAVSVDNVPTRRAVQAMLPKIAINGWTSPQGLGASWHEFGELGPCLACDYQPTGKAPSQYDLVMSALGLAKDRVYFLWLSGEGVNAEDLEVAARTLKIERSKLEPWLGKQIQDFFTGVVCGQVALDFSAGRGPLEAVPLAHQSVMAGLLMATELVKRTDASLRMRSQTQPMLVWDNVLHATPNRWVLARAHARGCICRDDVYRDRYRAKWLRD